MALGRGRSRAFSGRSYSIAPLLLRFPLELASACRRAGSLASSPSLSPHWRVRPNLRLAPLVPSTEIANRIRWGKFEVTDRNAQRLYSSKIVKNAKEIQDDCMELFGHKAVRPSSRACARCEQVHAREGVARCRLLALSWCRSPRCVGVSAHGGGVYRGHLRAEIGRCRSRGKPLPCCSLMEEPLSQRFPVNASGPSVGICPRPWL